MNKCAVRWGKLSENTESINSYFSQLNNYFCFRKIIHSNTCRTEKRRQMPIRFPYLFHHIYLMECLRTEPRPRLLEVGG